MKTLAVIGVITEVEPIFEADFIHSVTVDCGEHGTWDGVVKCELGQNDKVLVCLPDAIVPATERFEFMAPRKYIVKMCRLKGAPSEVLIIPLTPEEECFDVGHDLTEFLGVTKYEKTIQSGSMSQGQSAGEFFEGIPKTDEVNYQKFDWQWLVGTGDCYATIKYDGSSCTALVDEDGLQVASRNFKRKEFDEQGKTNGFWQAARLYRLERLPVGFCLQFEVVGPGIQKNPMGLANLEIRVFAGFHKTPYGTWERLPFYKVELICDVLDLPKAERVSIPKIESKDDLREFVDTVRYPNGKQAEGVVISSEHAHWSFKVISLSYKG